MGADSLKELARVLAVVGAAIGFVALITLPIRTRLSRILGVVSIGCLAIAYLILFIEIGAPRGTEALIVLLVPVPALLGIAFNRRKVIPPGHCKTCGYNLTGNVSGNCSECGAAVVGS